MNISIPTKLLHLIQGVTDEVSSSVSNAVSAVTPILLRNEAPFFPDYTDHGIQHINSVLQTCELLISEDAWNIFTREDAAVLILSVIGHDLGMLVSTETFSALIDPNNTNTIEPDDVLWHKLWREYRLAIRRFDGATLSNIVGSPEPVDPDELNPDNLTEKGRKLVGEFLRRHHHRLSHEIIVFGIPSESGLVKLFDGTSKHFKEIAGIIARSHGMSIRKCIDSIMSFDQTAFREFRYIHPTFLMALVRLADYLDLDQRRAPDSILSAKYLRSPISHREWWAHKAIVDCHSNTEDPECLHVVIYPAHIPNILTYLTIEEKIEGIQKELDNCWAVLGEIYGRFPPLNRLSLKIRRIKSDIRKETIIKQLPFIPHGACLKSSRSDLLKLLIAPLYGDKPEVGIRELLQNSIDAVRELKYLIQYNHNAIRDVSKDFEGKVIIKIEYDEEDNPWIEISDNGIGMTWETISNYYLNAGASFRNSDAWKKKFTSQTGDSQILRSGRFGIGVLAAFLLGDVVQVSTRYIDEPKNKGIFFQFGLDDITIEMKWREVKHGTTIRIKTNNKVIESLKEEQYYRSKLHENWDWFCLSEPKVFRYDETGKLLNQKYNLPQNKSNLLPSIHKIFVPGYEEIHWSYKSNIPGIVCNGILISEFGELSLFREFRNGAQNYNEKLELNNPKISVFDPNGHFPLNLARNSLAAQPHDINKILTEDICKNFITFCLFHGPQSGLLLDQQFPNFKISNYPGYSSSYSDKDISSFFFCTHNGFGLIDTYNMSFYTNEEPLLIIRGTEKRKIISDTVFSFIYEAYKLFFGSKADNTLGSFDNWHRGLTEFNDSYYCPAIFKQIPFSGVRCCMAKEWYKRFIGKQPKYVTRSLIIEYETKDLIIWTRGICKGSCVNLSILATQILQANLPFQSLSECYFSSIEENATYGGIAKVWEETIGAPIIPFDKQKREAIIEKLDDSFIGHIEEWRNKEKK